MSISSSTSDLFSIIKEPTLSFCLTSQKPLQKRNGRTDLDLVLKLNKNKLKKQPKSKYLKAKRCIAKLFCHQQKRLIKFERESGSKVSCLFTYCNLLHRTCHHNLHDHHKPMKVEYILHYVTCKSIPQNHKVFPLMKEREES